MASLCGSCVGRRQASGHGSSWTVSFTGVADVGITSRASFGSVGGDFAPRSHCLVLWWPSLFSIPPLFGIHFRFLIADGRSLLDFPQNRAVVAPSPLCGGRLMPNNPALGLRAQWRVIFTYLVEALTFFSSILLVRSVGMKFGCLRCPPGPSFVQRYFKLRHKPFPIYLEQSVDMVRLYLWAGLWLLESILWILNFHFVGRRLLCMEFLKPAHFIV